MSVEGGYRVLQHPRPERVFNRIADARWFLALSWCDTCPTPAAILTHDEQLSFANQASRDVGEIKFLPLEERSSIFRAGLSAESGSPTVYTIHTSDGNYSHQVKVMGLEIDPRYGKVAVVQALGMDSLLGQSPS